MEKFQISVKNLNNLWRFIEIYAVFVLNLCGEKSLWRKNDKGAGAFHSAGQSKEGYVGFGTSEHPIFMKLLPGHLWH